MIGMFMKQLSIQLLALHQPCIERLTGSSLSTYGLSDFDMEISTLPSACTIDGHGRCVPVVCTLEH